MNSPKSYFVLLAISCLLLLFSVYGKIFNPHSLNNRQAKWTIYLACFAQAIYGLFQFAGWLPSSHRYFTITGSFDNPAGFTSVLAAVFPLGLYLLYNLKGWKRCGLIICQLIILSGIIFSGSRTGILAVALAFIVFILLEYRERLLKLVLPRKLVLLPIAIALLWGCYFLYQQKKNSANGRLLIWQVSWQMIKDKPLLGHGYGSFQTEYMDYQAVYFNKHPNSGLAMLADNVKHPFNEFLKVTVEFGFAGLLTIIGLYAVIVYRAIKSKDDWSSFLLSGLTSISIFACFSYPFHYAPVWLMLVFYLSLLLPKKNYHIGYSTKNIGFRVCLFAITLIGIFIIIGHVEAEMRWKKIAIKSLNGDTQKMLPEYEKLYRDSPLKKQPLFLYNYGAELNHVGHYIQSNAILAECRKKFNDYDLQMLLAYNYEQTGKIGLALQRYQHAVEMIPCRFIPLYRLFKHYKENGNIERAREYAEQIACKQIKIPSPTVRAITLEAKNFLIHNQHNPNRIPKPPFQLLTNNQ
ncbi:O-antigen ligase family protein [Sunxiuqinia indica]|uniref:O-antigen ligase family protein n=1 Tax=Sunxiuqinia indica TaxID=2692584 RepID=UPI001359400D|nr:O-antigen ligase family protein [Sunxiuqinia indica]